MQSKTSQVGANDRLTRRFGQTLADVFRKAKPLGAPEQEARGRKQPPFQPSRRQREKLFPMF